MDGSRQVKIYVRDSGVGVKTKDQSKLFRLFGSIKDTNSKFSIDGIGIGLVICKMIVEKFNGVIGFKSKDTKGTEFYFTFELKNDY